MSTPPSLEPAGRRAVRLRIRGPEASEAPIGAVPTAASNPALPNSSNRVDAHRGTRLTPDSELIDVAPNVAPQPHAAPTSNPDSPVAVKARHPSPGLDTAPPACDLHPAAPAATCPTAPNASDTAHPTRLAASSAPGAASGRAVSAPPSYPAGAWEHERRKRSRKHEPTDSTQAPAKMQKLTHHAEHEETSHDSDIASQTEHVDQDYSVGQPQPDTLTDEAEDNIDAQERDPVVGDAQVDGLAPRLDHGINEGHDHIPAGLQEAHSPPSGRTLSRRFISALDELTDVLNDACNSTSDAIVSGVIRVFKR
ncbi:hypothetical protein PSPO01_14593 [Paraphaeosphaeria sporulosa]